jgi:hypothetical protein
MILELYRKGRIRGQLEEAGNKEEKEKRVFIIRCIIHCTPLASEEELSYNKERVHGGMQFGIAKAR